jgi:hypothetical protein
MMVTIIWEAGKPACQQLRKDICSVALCRNYAEMHITRNYKDVATQNGAKMIDLHTLHDVFCTYLLTM